jgi:hypothetical protein
VRNSRRGVKKLLAVINEAPDPLHLDITPAVRELSERGLEAVPGLLTLMLDSDSMTRLHAQRALEGVVNRRHGFRAGAGFSAKADEKEARDLWRINGGYDFEASDSSRTVSVERWREWLDHQ